MATQIDRPPRDWRAILGLPTVRRPLLGLALGGGGARGYAHIGVLRAFERAGIAVDFLAGTSMGGLIAAGSAMGMDAAALEHEALTVRTRSLLDLSLPRMGLLEGKKVREHLTRIFGNATFADTRVPLRLVAVDLDTGEELALGEGSLVDAIRATISVPGVFCPAPWQGRLLVDGGVVNNVPADVVRAMGAEVVVAVSVGWTTFQPLSSESGRRPISLPALARMSPMVNALIRSAHIMEAEILRHRLAQAHPDVLLSPEVGSVELEDFERAAEVIPTGEQAAEAALPRLRELLRPRLLPRLPPRPARRRDERN